jgi:5S rRNA maturation endonuclease (ribonuclease M5)
MIDSSEFQKLMIAIEELREMAKLGWVIVVEGVKDRESLRKLGVEGEIILFSGYSETADKIRERKTIILTDFDEKGNEIEKGLVKAMSSWGNIPDQSLKKKIFSATRKEILKVEELYSFVEKCRISLRI